MRVNLAKVVLVEPDEGWDYLHPKLYKAFAIGRNRGYTDLGTHVAKPGDHGYKPGRAFDLGRKDNFLFKGWYYLKARYLCAYYWKHRKALNIDYLILGSKIISRNKPYWRPYTRDTSHNWHIHVSMWWEGKYGGT